MRQHHLGEVVQTLSNLQISALDVVMGKFRRGILGFALCCFGGCFLLSAGPCLAEAKTDAVPASDSVVDSIKFWRKSYNPAVIHLRFTPAEGKTSSAKSDAFLDLTLITSSGNVEGFVLSFRRKSFEISCVSCTCSYRALSL